MPCPAVRKSTQSGLIHLLPLVVLAVVLLAGLALLTGNDSSKEEKDVLGVSTQNVETRNVASTREHNVFGVKVKTAVTNVVDANTGHVLEVKPSFSDLLIGLLGD